MGAFSAIESAIPMPKEVWEYSITLTKVTNYLSALGLTEMPTSCVTIIDGTQGPGRPLGAKLPVFPQEECGTDEIGMKKALFNLYTLTGFVPPR